MDGPNTNWSFLGKLKAKLNDDPASPLPLDIGSCGLHTVHGIFKAAFNASDWRIMKLFVSLYYVFHDSPARRSDYEAHTGSSTFPLKCCVTRWVENRQVAERALKIWDNVVAYVTWVSKLSKSKQPQSESFLFVRQATADKLIPAKINFFLSVANILEPFLKYFQSHDKPMSILLPAHLERMTRQILDRFLKPGVMDGCAYASQLMALNLADDGNLCVAKDVEIGLATNASLPANCETFGNGAPVIL